MISDCVGEPRRLDSCLLITITFYGAMYINLTSKYNMLALGSCFCQLKPKI
jgi:hypothetical protein